LANKLKIAVLPGDGIGPEVMDEAIKILKIVSKKHSLNFEFNFEDVGGIAYDKYKSALPKQTIEICEKSSAILFGSIGGPKWDDLPKEGRVEKVALLGLRKHFNFFANLRPAICYKPIANISPIKNEIVKDGFDMLIVRELTGDCYFGEKKITDDYAFDAMEYKRNEVERIAKVAFEAAMKRKRKVTCVDKSNVLATSVLFRKYVTEVSKKYPQIALNFMYVDNAAMQLIKNPHDFDVIVTTNMFGDILSDEAAMITGSIGMMPSASLNEKDFGMYEPAGGSAPDIAGKGIANPIAQIMSAAMMMKYSFKRDDIYMEIEDAIIRVIEKNRTIDIMEKGCIQVTTKQMGDLIAEKLY